MITVETSPSLALRRIRRECAANRIKGDHASWGGGKWRVYGADFKDYEHSFRFLNVDLLSLVNEKSPQVIVDLMAPSYTLASLFRQTASRSNFGLALTLEDMRSDERKIEDRNLNIKQLTGDIMRLSTWRDIKDELKGRKANIIIERAMGGLSFLPMDSLVYQFLLRRAWEILTNQDGILILQTPSEKIMQYNGIDIKKWMTNLRCEGIKVDWNKDVPESRNSMSGISVLKLVKEPNSPKKFPYVK